MVDIYDELGHIKNVLEHGLDPMRWERDASLLARFWAAEGRKKSDVKVSLKEKCRRYAFNYNPYRDYKRVNKIVDSAFKDQKNGKPIRHTSRVVFPREVLDWFLGLDESFVVSKEKSEEIARNRKCRLSERPMNFNRVKTLFTLYVWTLIQSDYIQVANIHYLKKYMKKFKDDADLPSSFSMNRELNILRDLGLLYINSERGVDVVFLKEFEVFKTPVTDENRVELSGEDLYKCGIWLEKQKFGSYVCQNCGREFPFKGLGKGEKRRKYCPECHDRLFRHKAEDLGLERECVDCGRYFSVEESTSRVRRCEECQHKRDLESKRRYKERKRAEEMEESEGVSGVDEVSGELNCAYNPDSENSIK